jgi:Mrp family chromosome partitioning ATPase/capsular polysaccharide biosynthesis protein
MESQAKVIKGFPVMKKVALKMGLINEDTPLSEAYEIVANLGSRIETERIGNTNIIKIIARTSDPKEAMDLANTVAACYIEENLLEKNKQARTVRKFIEEQLFSMEKRLHEAEEKLKTFGEEVQNIHIADDVENKLTELEFKLASLLQKYTEKHPKIIQLKEQIKELEAQLKGFSGRELEYARLKREVEVNRKIYAMLREKLEEVRITEAEKVPDVSVVNPAVLPTSPINIQPRLYIFLGGFLGLMVGVILSFLSESLDTSIGTIEDVESVVKLPVLGVVPSVPYEKEIGKHLEKFKRKIFPKKVDERIKRYVRLVSHYHPTSPIAESFRNIKTNIKFSPTRKTILVTSAGPQEGKTTILVNLGLVSAQDGLKVLFLSSDLRRPALADTFGLENKPGLSDVIMGTVTLKEAIRDASDMLLGEIQIEEILKHPGLERIWVLPSGSLPLNPTEILDSPELNNILTELKNDFDVVLLDAPPVLPVTDASILANKVDGVILCYEIGRTSRHALIRAKMQLESVGANILGIVMNHTQPQTEAIEVHPYYYKYRYYGKEEKGHFKKR